jgi:Cu/Ag efflux protein CusF
MQRIHGARMMMLIATTVGVLLFLPLLHAQQGGKNEHPFRGTVEKVDATAKTLTVKGERVQGWMGAMTMRYSVDPEDVLNVVKAGDQIAATVHDGDVKTLYDVQIVPVPDKK